MVHCHNLLGRTYLSVIAPFHRRVVKASLDRAARVRLARGACPRPRRRRMITCYLRYVIDPDKAKEFEHYGKLWLPLVAKFGGTHHGYFLPSEGANNIALALFSFPSLAAYEDYRTRSFQDPDCTGRLRVREGNPLHRELRAELLPAGVSG